MDRLIEILETLKPDMTFTADTKIAEDNVFDSIGYISLVAEISDEFDVDISPVDIVPENFATVATILKMIERLSDED